MKYHKSLLALTLLCACNFAFATSKPPTTPTPTPNPSTTVTGHQDQNQHQSNQQGQGQDQTATGTGLGIGVGVGGNSASNATGGNANATGGRGGDGGSALSGSTSGAVSGSQSGVQGSGNADVRTNTTIGPVGSTSSSGSLSGAAASNGDQSTNVRNGSESNSSARTGDQNTRLDTSDVNLVSTGSASDSQSTSAGGSSDNAVNVDASTDSNYTAQALYLPSVPVNVPVGVPGGDVTVYYGTCGPLKAIESERVTGTYIGFWRKQSIDLGRSDRIVPYQGGEYIERTYSDGSTRLFGHQAVRTVALVSVAGGRSITLGGGQTGGNWGQAGAGGSSAMQQVVTQIDLEPCEAFHTKPPAVIQFNEPRVPRG